MHIKIFDKFSLGNFIDKKKKDKPEDGDETTVEFTEIEAVSNPVAIDQSNDELNQPAPEETMVPSEDLSSEDLLVGPHGPVAELTLEAEDLQTGDHVTLDEVGPDKEAEEETQTIETSAAETTAAPALEIKEETKSENTDDSSSLNDLFNMDEEEENPLASLINSMPEVTAQELMDDLAEIKRIIKEWRPNAKIL